MPLPLITVDDIRRIAQEIFDDLGMGYIENNYQNALLLELRKLDRSCRTEVETPVLYKGRHIGWARADIVTSEYIIELKALDTWKTAKVENQIRKYLRHLFEGDGIVRTGIMINFNQDPRHSVGVDVQVVIVNRPTIANMEEDGEGGGVAACIESE